MARVVPSHLMDRKLFAFAGIEPTGIADVDGDRAFDGDDGPAGASIGGGGEGDTIVALPVPMRGDRPPRGELS